MMRRLRSASSTTFRSLRARNFKLFMAGQLVSQTGTWMQTVAVIWVVLELTDSGVALGVVTAAQFLPVLLLGAWGGVLADRLDRHRFMTATQILFTFIAASFAGLMILDALAVGVIYVLSFAFGVVTAIDNPTRRTLVADLVDRADVANAVALHSAMMTGSRVIGPAVAGVLIATVGVQWCFVVNTVTYLAVIGALLAMDRSRIRPAPRVPRRRGQLVEGFRYVWATENLRYSILLLAVVGTLAFEYQVTLPLLAERTLGAGAGGFTLLYSAMSLGSVLGALVIARRASIDVQFLLRAAWGLTLATIALAASPTLPVAALTVVLVGAATIFMVAGANALIQTRADEAMRGRALALTTVVFLGSTPIGGPIVGWISEYMGARAGLLVGAAGTAVAAMWVRRKTRWWSEAPEPPASHTVGERAPGTADDIADPSVATTPAGASANGSLRDSPPSLGQRRTARSPCGSSAGSAVADPIPSPRG